MKSYYKEKTEINNMLFGKLKLANNECIKAKVDAYEIALKYASLCVQMVREYIDKKGHAPELINDVMQKRYDATDGRNYLDEDFWANEDMIIALFEHLQEEFDWDIEEKYG